MRRKPVFVPYFTNVEVPELSLARNATGVGSEMVFQSGGGAARDKFRGGRCVGSWSFTDWYAIS